VDFQFMFFWGNPKMRIMICRFEVVLLLSKVPQEHWKRTQTIETIVPESCDDHRLQWLSDFLPQFPALQETPTLPDL